MVTCLFGGQSFYLKTLPIAGLDAGYLRDVAHQCAAMIEACGGKAIASRTTTESIRPRSPWFGNPAILRDYVLGFGSPRPFFLRSNTVHLFRNVRNNWLAEKTKELVYRYGDSHNVRVAVVGKRKSL